MKLKSKGGQVFSLTTKLNADVVSWCPIDGFHDCLIVCMYQLVSSDSAVDGEGDKKKKAHTGGLELYQLQEVESPSDPEGESSHPLILADSLIFPESGVFRMEWFVTNTTDDQGPPQLMLALTNGSIGLVTLVRDGPQKQVSFSNQQQIPVDPEKVLTCITKKPHSDNSTQVVVGDNTGFIHHVDLTEGKVVKSWKAHSFGSCIGSHIAEVWNLAFDRTNTDRLYSGGDDCMMKVWDLSTMDDTCPVSPVGASKDHSAGVTCFNTDIDGKLLTGSYDQNVRLFDLRHSLKTPISQLDTDGGVWNIECKPTTTGSSSLQQQRQAGTLIAVSAMYGGWRVLKIAEEHPLISEEFKWTDEAYGESILYGVSWNHSPPADNNGASAGSLIAACSFYSNTVELFAFENE